MICAVETRLVDTINPQLYLQDLERGLGHVYHTIMRRKNISIAVHSSSEMQPEISARIEIMLAALKSTYQSKL